MKIAGTETEYLTVKQAAAELGLSDVGIRRRIQRGDMHAERIGRKTLMIPLPEVERWRALGKLPPGPAPRSRHQSSGAELLAENTEHLKVLDAAWQHLRNDLPQATHGEEGQTQ